MSVAFIHNRLADAMLIFSVVAGAWGLVAYVRRQGVTPSYWGILVMAELLYGAQGVVGILLWLQGLSPARGIHWLYGAVALLTLPGYFALSRGRDDRRAALAYGLLSLFLAGIGLRAAGTG